MAVPRSVAAAALEKLRGELQSHNDGAKGFRMALDADLGNAQTWLATASDGDVVQLLDKIEFFVQVSHIPRHWRLFCP